MQPSKLIAILFAASLPLVLADQTPSVSYHTRQQGESARLKVAEVVVGGERLGLLVPHGWTPSSISEQRCLALAPRSGESSIAICFSEQNAQALLADSEALRQAVVPYLEDAIVLNEFPVYADYGPGRAVDFAFTLAGQDMRARVAVVPLARGFASFVVTRPVLDFEAGQGALSGIVTSFHRSTNDVSRPGGELAVFASDLPKTVRVVEEARNQMTLIPDLPLPPEYGPQPVRPPHRSIFEGRHDYLWLFLAGTLGAIVVVIMLDRHKREAEIRALRGGYLSDGTEVASFVMPDLFASQAQLAGTQALEEPVPDFYVGEEKGAPVRTQADEFFEKAPEYLGALRKALQELGRAGNEKDWARALSELPQHVVALKEKANFWEVRPVWQMSSALELLVKRVVEKPKDATPSTLRSIGAAVDLLHSLCVPGIRPNLVIDPPIQILAADDDALCLRAILFALQKASLTADTAANGIEALALATRKAYDVILMDIQMPEMDGLAAAGKLHETQFNADTPVVFVTIQSDFLTRAQSTQCTAQGGGDLMAKPFLVFELTVKVLTFIMRKRLRAIPAKIAVLPGLPGAEPVRPAAPAPVTPAQPSAATAGRPNTPAVAAPGTARTDNASAPARRSESAHEFFVEASSLLATTRKLVEGLADSADDVERQARLGNARSQLVTLITKAEPRHFSIIPRIASTLEALLKRLHKNPRAINLSTIHTATQALNLLERLCLPGMERKLADQPARILVVDDEPLARRAMVGALQLAFEKPESADDGQAALALIDRRHYDVIFTDIGMPGLDGYALCKHIRDGTANPHTPVVFITSHTDMQSRNQAAEVGGTDFICKPFLPIEISVKALTLTWEGRLQEVATRENRMILSALENAARGAEETKASGPQDLAA